MTTSFVIGGAQKSGTTALSKFVSAHPQIAFSTPQETHFFDRDGPYLGNEEAGLPDQPARDTVPQSYRQHFEVTPQTVAIGESTPIYMYWRPCPERIGEFDSGMKWIVILRNPVDRAYSQWVMESGRGREDLDFPDAIRAENQRLSDAGGQHRHWSYVARGQYSWQLERLFDIFGQDQTLVLLNDDLNRNHQQTLASVWDFLSVEHIDVPPERVFSQRYPQMKTADRLYLKSLLAPEVVRLEELLDRSLSSWR